jgi:DNA-binding NtrC family response regulator
MAPDDELARSRSGERPRTGHVLIIDDDLLVAQSLSRVLSGELQVTFTTRPAEALGWIVAGESYDVILCDVMMAGMNGVELRDRVDAVCPEQAARIVFITGGLTIPSVRALLDRVPNTCLEKPIDVDGLRELIHRRVRAWRRTSRAV